MDEVALLKPKLTRLKLAGMLDTLTERLQQAMAEKWSYTQLLDTLLTDEVERREFKQLARRLSKSGLAPDKTLETFDDHPRADAARTGHLRFVERRVPGRSVRRRQERRSGARPRRVSQGVRGHLRAHRRPVRLAARRSRRRQP